MYAKPRSDSSVLLNIVLCSEFATAKVQQNLQVCKFLRRKVKSVGCRGGDTRRINAEHLTGSR